MGDGINNYDVKDLKKTHQQYLSSKFSQDVRFVKLALG